MCVTSHRVHTSEFENILNVIQPSLFDTRRDPTHNIFWVEAPFNPYIVYTIQYNTYLQTHNFVIFRLVLLATTFNLRIIKHQLAV